MDHPSWVLLAEYDTALQAEIYLSALHNAGIYAILRNNVISGIIPTHIFRVQLFVPATQKDEALKILNYE